MIDRSTGVALLASLLLATPVPAPAATANDCAALDQLLREARSDFPALKDKKVEAATCLQRSQQFKCEWSFPADTFASAETQAARLARCTASLPGVRPVAAKRGEKLFQINPETLVLVQGPELDSGSWRIRLQISTTAEWE